ncbi:MAG: hypothetical protein AB7S75_23735 [Desulfococcaceae bacterium]
MSDNDNKIAGSTLYDLIRVLIQGYGLIVTLVVLLIGIISIWGLAYWTAEPGQKISVGFGLLEYIKKSVPSPEIPLPSLISMSFKVYEFNPRKVDLSSIATIGIPALPNKELQLVDLWVLAPITKTLLNANYTVHAEVYIHEEVIGHTETKPIIVGKAMELGDILIDKYQDTQGESWIVRQEWKELRLVLVTCNQDNKVVNQSGFIIQLNQSSQSWLSSSPFVKFGSIIYTINDNSPRIFDMRNETIQAQPGDKLTLHEIWYRSDIASDSFKIKLEAYLTGNGYDPSTSYTSKESLIRRGNNPLVDFMPMSWTIPQDKNQLILWLSRNDKVIVDGLSIFLKTDGNPGLPVSK